MSRFNFYAGAAAAATLLTVMVIAAEFIPAFKALLATLFTHHWVGKMVLTTGAFLLAGLFYKGETIRGVDSEKAAWLLTLGALAIIFLFFIIHYFL